MPRGPFIVLEGTDGSGKGTQFRLLVERLRRERVPLATFDFPQYGKPSAYFIEEYLRGAYKGIGSVSPKQGSLFYALDRFAAAPQLREAIKQKKLVLSNRFTASNMGHQGSKLATRRERTAFFKWLDELEFGILNIPRPTLNIILNVPAKIAQRLVDEKKAKERAYAKGAKRDLHEKSLMHLKKTEAVYRELTKLFPGEFVLIECAPKGVLLSITEIHEQIWRRIQPLLRRVKP